MTPGAGSGSAEGRGSAGEPRTGPPDAPAVSLWDSIRFNVSQVAPQLLRGMFIRRPRVSSLVDRWHPDPLGVRLIEDLRRRYRSDYLWLTVAGTSTLLVLEPEGIRHVLEASPEVYGPPSLKVRGMSHFQPGAVTISTGSEWRRRRAFNEEVLGTGRRIHPRAGELLAVVEEEVRPMLDGRSGPLTRDWTDVRRAFRRITSGVVFGPGTDAPGLLDTLDRLRRRANRIVGESETDELRAFRDETLHRLCADDAGGLSAEACPHVEPDDPLPVAGQVPHWLFALKDTLAANWTAALALVAAHPEAQEKARADARSGNPSDPAAVDEMPYLEGCLRDAMRLWPTTPMIVRRARRDDVVRGRRVEKDAQVVIHNGYNHRSPDAGLADPDAFRPEAWEPGVRYDRFNALSGGPQGCAGRELVLLLGKAMLAHLLRDRHWRLVEPDLDPGRALPHAFDPSAVVLSGSPAG